MNWDNLFWEKSFEKSVSLIIKDVKKPHNNEKRKCLPYKYKFNLLRCPIMSVANSRSQSHSSLFISNEPFIWRFYKYYNTVEFLKPFKNSSFWNRQRTFQCRSKFTLQLKPGTYFETLYNLVCKIQFGWHINTTVSRTKDKSKCLEQRIFHV